MNKKSNIDRLREIVEDDAALEFLDAVAEELEAADEDIADLRLELRGAKEEIAELNEYQKETTTARIHLGLDTLHYRLEHGNLRVQQQLGEWINNIKQENGAGVLMPG